MGKPQGTITGDGKVVVKDSRDGSTPVDLPLDKVFFGWWGKMFGGVVIFFFVWLKEC